MLRALFVAAALLSAPATAYAFSCPSMMAEIDAALPAAELSDEDRQKVVELRAEGERLHGEGNHDGSEAALTEAKEILGI